MKTIYTIGDEVRYKLTGEYMMIIDDSQSDDGFYTVYSEKTHTEYCVHISELT